MHISMFGHKTLRQGLQLLQFFINFAQQYNFVSTMITFLICLAVLVLAYRKCCKCLSVSAISATAFKRVMQYVLSPDSLYNQYYVLQPIYNRL
jgi:hypothetical protein